MTVILKLVNGTEVVGTLKTGRGDMFVLDKPLQINYRFYQGSTPSVSFVRYIMFANTDIVPFNREDVMQCMAARDAFAAYYLNVVDNYYSKLEALVDTEFNSLLTEATAEKRDPLTSILDMMSIDDATVN